MRIITPQFVAIMELSMEIGSLFSVKDKIILVTVFPDPCLLIVRGEEPA
jgi:hypothetical protein